MNVRNAFTLIELLVVVAIIALLAAILFPVFAAAREKARSAACHSNLKQLGLAFQQYTQDNDELMLLGNGAYSATYGAYQYRGQGWVGPLYPYAKNLQVFQCPDQTQQPTSAAAAAGYVAQSYAYNSDLIGGTARWVGQTNSPRAGINLAKLNAPTETIMLYEAYNNTVNAANVYNDTESDSVGGDLSNGDSFYGGFSGANTSGNPSNLQAATGYIGGITFYMQLGGLPVPSRHTNSSNFLFTDGHVKFIVDPALVSAGVAASSPTSPAGAPGSGQSAGTGNLGNCQATFSPT